MMRRCLALSALVLFFASLSAFASSNCIPDGWSCSDTLSTLNQNYPPLLHLGWKAKKDNGSRLCGPIAMINGLNRLRHFAQLPIVNPWDDIVDMHEALGALGLSSTSLRNGGIMTYDLERIVHWYATKMGVKTETEILGLEVSEEALLARGTAPRRSIALDHFKVGEGEVVIVNFERFLAEETEHVFPTDQSLKSGWVSGHFVVLTSRSPRNVSALGMEIEVQDPDSGIQLISLKPVRPAAFGIETFEWFPPRSNAPRRWSRAFITNVLRIRVARG